MPHVELTDDELRLLREALHSYLDDFGHEEADVLRRDQGADREAAVRPACLDE